MSKKVGKLARRYAKALLAAAEKELGTNGLPSPAQQLAAQMEGFVQAWNGANDLKDCMLSPMFDQSERVAALKQVADVLGLPDLAGRFLATLSERDRLGAIEEIAQQFKALADEAANVVQVEILTARSVERDEVAEIEKLLQKRIEGRPVFHWNTNPELLGGIVVKYHGRVLDGSVSGQLTRLERSLRPGA